MSQVNQFEVEVLVHGKPVQEYLHKGNNYIEGKEGTEFSLRLRNRSSKRALFVPTIDGLSVMDGKKASFKSSGYIVDAYSSETIDGWRTSNDEVAKFFFSKISESYAEKKDHGENIGVIGCAVFKEKEREPEIQIIKTYIKEYPVYPTIPTYPWWPHNGGIYMTSGITSSSSLSASNASMRGCSDVSAGVGTGFGDSKYSPVRTVDFERSSSSPDSVITIYYNTREKLEEMGVEFKRIVNIAPSAFPKEEDGYCLPPKGWKR